MISYLTITHAAEVLGVTKRALNDWLNKHPLDVSGRAFYVPTGRTKIFNANDIHRIRRAMKITEAAAKQETADRWAAQDGHIYFIECAGRIKIGWSMSWQKRIRHLQTAAPGTIKVLGVIAGTVKQERQFHRAFAAHRAQGEWFRNEGDLAEYIRNCNEHKLWTT